MELSEGLDLARGRHQGILVTIGRTGRAQISNLLFHMDGADVASISTTDATVKVRNLRRDPRCSLYVPGSHFFEWVVLDGTAVVSPPALSVDSEVVDSLVAIYRAVSGEHPDWADFREAMVRDRRVVVRLTPEHAYGMLPR